MRRDAQAVDRLPMLPESERRRVLYEWNDTRTEFPTDRCVHQLFEQQARKTPDAVALIFEQRQLCYAELNRRANRLAHYLRQLGIGPDARVAICVERGFEMIAALLAVLKAGGAYVPLDPGYPPERLRFMLDDCAPVALLTQGHLQQLFKSIGQPIPLLDLNSQDQPWKNMPPTNLLPESIGLNPTHLAYVIYTSGSTGKPKGVMIEHANIGNLIHWHRSAFITTHGQRSSCLAGFGFDAATWEILSALCLGGELALPSPAEIRDPEKLLAWWRYQPLDISFLPTPMAELAFSQNIVNTHLRTLLVGGDRLRRLPISSPPFSIVNNYGPTEITVVATSGQLDHNPNVLTIGRPIANTRVYILDAVGQPVPVGVSGELYIGGAQVARGYLNRPELTAEKFLADPFVSQPGARMYRTGDLGRWLEDGNIEFLGRNDFQVKIRGFRIELGEIEARLMEHPGVREAVAIARQDAAGDKQLAAYYTCSEDGAQIDAEQLRSHLSALLPDYMVPAAYVHLEALPLTPNGKLDRGALPAPEPIAQNNRRLQTPDEHTISTLFAEVLGVQQVALDDDFFQLGGHFTIGNSSSEQNSGGVGERDPNPYSL